MELMVPIVTTKTASDFTNVRVSLEQQKLLSKPASSKYEAYRRSVYYFLERPESRFALCYHLMNLVLILTSIVISILSTIDTFEEDQVLRRLIVYYELSLLSWFTVEYLLRLWSCSFLGKYRGCCGKLRFMRTLYMMIDAFVIISTLTTAILSVKITYFSILRITRFLQIFRILRLDRQRGDLRTMGRVVYKHRKELITCYFVGFIILLGGTYIVYIIEKSSATDSSIDNMANGLYWAMITVTSVGYGDISPKSWPGKMISGVFALVGCAFFALPSGILGSGFALQVAKQKKQRRYVKVRNPAAIVIQACWRNYAVKPNKYELQATWNVYFPQAMKQHRKLSNVENFDTSALPGMTDILRPEYFMMSPVNRQPRADLTKEKSRKGKLLCVFNNTKRKEKEVDNHFHVNNNGSIVTTTSNLEVPRKNSSSSTHRHRKRSSNNCCNSSNPDTPTVSTLIQKHYKHTIRFIMRVKLFHAIKQFKNIRYPFVNVQDIMEKNALCHTETISHLKSIQDSLQEFRIELNSMKNILYRGRKSAVTPLDTPANNLLQSPQSPMRKDNKSNAHLAVEDVEEES